MLTHLEATQLVSIRDRLDRLREFLVTASAPPMDAGPGEWFAYLDAVKTILGNFNNDLSLVSCLLAKQYLVERFDLPGFDVALKPQGAAGLDIDVVTTQGERIIGEIKTTHPYKAHDFGAAQHQSFRTDFLKLKRSVADRKFMFVTSEAAFDVLMARCLPMLPGVTIVCLATGREHTSPITQGAT